MSAFEFGAVDEEERHGGKRGLSSELLSESIAQTLVPRQTTFDRELVAIPVVAFEDRSHDQDGHGALLHADATLPLPRLLHVRVREHEFFTDHPGQSVV